MLKVGMILVPKPEFKKLFRKNCKYVVAEKDIKQNGTIGDMWMIKN